MNSADELIEQLALAAHPEGGWYRETHRAAPKDGVRAAWTAITFLLRSGERSHWHKVDADELWIWQGGDPLKLSIAEGDSGPVRTTTLGPDPSLGQLLQGLVPPHQWQAAQPANGQAGYALMSCVVTPGFEFSGFELAPPEWNPGNAA